MVIRVTDIRFVEKDHSLWWIVMNAELPPFKNREHDSENASTIDRVITPLINSMNSFWFKWWLSHFGDRWYGLTAVTEHPAIGVQEGVG